MASKITERYLRLLPLWKRRIPKYPVYWKGNPQLRVFLPQFWMKIVKPEYDVPPHCVHFIVHPQMTRIDIKNYLEKIYKVPVLKVSTDVRQGEDILSPKTNKVTAREDDYKLAFVQLGEGCTFEFPKLFEKSGSPAQKEVDEYTKLIKTEKKQQQKHWDRLSLPPWFR